MNEKLKDTELEAATGGMVPELPATNLDTKEIHIYKNELTDPEQFTAKMGEGKAKYPNVNLLSLNDIFNS